MIQYTTELCSMRCMGIIKGTAHSIISILRTVGSYSTPLEVIEMTFDLCTHEAAQITHFT